MPSNVQKASAGTETLADAIRRNMNRAPGSMKHAYQPITLADVAALRAGDVVASGTGFNNLSDSVWRELRRRIQNMRTVDADGIHWMVAEVAR